MTEGKPKRKVDRWATYNYFQDKLIRLHKLKSVDIAVWHAMFRHANNGGIVKLSKSRMLEESGIGNKRTLNRALEKLMEIKLIGIVRQGGTDKTKGSFCTVWWIKGKLKSE